MGWPQLELHCAHACVSLLCAQLKVDAANEKSCSFAFFAEIHRRCKKSLIGTGIKPNATAVPQVNGLKFVNDPQFQHLM